MSATATRPMDRVTKKKLTVAEAAEQWEHAKREIDRLKPELEEAKAVLIDHFEKTGKNSYRNRIGLTIGSRLVLDQTAVREYLGKQLDRFQKRISTKSLTLLGE
jgi:hypothetical protein